MAIRMEKDEQQPRRDEPNSPQPGGGGGGRSLLKFLPIVLFFLFRNPKLILPVLIIGAIAYFTLGGEFFNQFLPAQESNNAYSLGFTSNQEEYDKRLVFASLADGRNDLPTKISLREYTPPRLNQGRQGSCVGWASAYGARTILHARQTGQAPRNVAFSPSYVYNQIAFQGCQGTYLHYAMETMLNNGALPFSQFEYDESSCRLKPTQNEIRSAQQFKIRGYERLSLGANNYKVDISAIKQNISAGAPVVIGMMVGQSFTAGMRNKRTWQPTRTDINGINRLGGHAMCVIGYDDTYSGGKGAFEIMNSWGNDWGDDGICFVEYEDFEYFVKEAYGLYPMGSAKDVDQTKLSVKFGLVDNATQRNIPLSRFSNNIFKTRSPIQIGQKFKVEVTNSIDCYTYIYALQADGSTEVLFPYTQQHSAYCGITGTRIFPRDYSMVADDVGTNDWIAVVVSKKSVDFEAINTAINRSSKETFPGQVTEALSNQLVESVQFNSGGSTIDFVGDVGNKNAVVMFISIDKQ